MDDLDTLFRGGAIGIALLLGAADWRARPNSGFAWTGLLYAAGVIAYLLAGHPGFADWRPLARLVAGAFALSVPFFFWAQARLIFDDGFRLRLLHWLVLGLIEAAGVLGMVLRAAGSAAWLPELLGYAVRAISLLLIGQALWVVWHGRGVDLVEARARTRLSLVLIAGVAIALIIVEAVLSGPAPGRPPLLKLGEAAALLLLNLTFATALLRLERDFVPAPLEAAAATSPVGAISVAARPAAAGDEDAEALARLAHLMDREAAWRETGLTIGGLAARVLVPEYRLRRLINQRLGFRNFTAFLNEYRLAAAAERLADRKRARTPILTIALDLGWASIGPFNRAFRARYGVPPSDYRRQQSGNDPDRKP